MEKTPFEECLSSPNYVFVGNVIDVLFYRDVGRRVPFLLAVDDGVDIREVIFPPKLDQPIRYA